MSHFLSQFFQGSFQAKLNQLTADVEKAEVNISFGAGKLYVGGGTKELLQACLIHHKENRVGKETEQEYTRHGDHVDQ